MTLTAQTAKLFRDLYYGGNWTGSCIKENLEGLDWKQATVKIHSLNTIAALVYHIDYYVSAVLRVLQDQPINAKDKYSFDHPPIHSREDWEALLQKFWANAENFANALEQFPDEKIGEIFVDEKYGSYYRNFHGVIEHAHYHLGQIVIIKKLIRDADAA